VLSEELTPSLRMLRMMSGIRHIPIIISQEQHISLVEFSQNVTNLINVINVTLF